MPSAPGSPRPNSLILTVYGGYARRLGGWLAVADLVTLMGHLGIEEHAVRVAVSRLARRGVLVRERRDKVSGYGLSDEGMALLEEGDRRIYGALEPAKLDDGWVVVSFSVPERERDRRHALRSRLTWLGCGNLAGGVWIAPRRILPELHRAVRRLGLEGYVDLFTGAYGGFHDLREVVERSWDLASLRKRYAEFLQECREVLERWDGAGPATGLGGPAGPGAGDERQAFVDYTLSLHRWRKFPYLDPGLPPELLPDNWEGQSASAAFSAIRARLEQPALRHVAAVTGSRRQ